MRLDKFLKVSRLVKRRSVATELCKSDRVVVNGRPAKASYSVMIDDVIEFSLGARSQRVKVIAIKDHTDTAGARELYEVMDEGPG